MAEQGKTAEKRRPRARRLRKKTPPDAEGAAARRLRTKTPPTQKEAPLPASSETKAEAGAPLARLPLAFENETPPDAEGGAAAEQLRGKTPPAAYPRRNRRAGAH